jgi:hypothetical protein
MRTLRQFVFATLAILAVASTGLAAPITYVHTGIGSGTLDGVGFGAVSFTITATGETENIQSCGGRCLSNDNITAAIQIGALGTFNFISETRYFFNFAGDEPSDPAIVGFARGRTAPFGGVDLFDGPNLATWDMATSVGPIVGTANLLLWGFFGTVQTTGGVLVFNNGSTPSTFTATVGTAPEPATLALLGAALAVGLVRRRSHV